MNRSAAPMTTPPAGSQTQSPATLALAVRELDQHLAQWQAALTQLAGLGTEKLAALRRADTAALQTCAGCEEELLKGLFRGQQRREAALARVAQSLHCPQSPCVRLKDIVDRLPEPLASSLRARSVALREIAAELQRKNRLAAGVARNLQAHIRGIFADVATAAQEAVVYGPQGQHETGRPRCWVDAVG